MKKEQKYICKLCGYEAKNITALTTHLQYKHKDYNTQRYYDEFYKKPNEGFCEVCGKETKFRDMVKGYNKHCCKSCAHKTKHFRDSYNEAISKKSDKEVKSWRKRGRDSIRAQSSTGKCITDKDLQKREYKTLQHYKSWFPYITEYHNNIVKGICPKCHNEFVIDRWLLHTRHVRNMLPCLNCCPKNSYGIKGTSHFEEEVKTFIKEKINADIEENNRTILEGYELDIWIPKYNTAIEVDGTYWHADPRKYKATDIIKQIGLTAQEIWKKDKMKDGFAKRKGIILIRVKEIDWNADKDLIKQQLLEQFK